MLAEAYRCLVDGARLGGRRGPVLLNTGEGTSSVVEAQIEAIGDITCMSTCCLKCQSARRYPDAEARLQGGDLQSNSDCPLVSKHISFFTRTGIR